MSAKLIEPVSKRPILVDLKRWAQISILEILKVLLWLKFSPALSLTKLKRFESGSNLLSLSKKTNIEYRTRNFEL